MEALKGLLNKAKEQLKKGIKNFANKILKALLTNPWFWLVCAVFFILIIVVGTFIDIDSGNDELYYSDGYEEGSDWWWPIGSFETTTENGKLFASGDPASTLITSYHGYEERRKTP